MNLNTAKTSPEAALTEWAAKFYLTLPEIAFVELRAFFNRFSSLGGWVAEYFPEMSEHAASELAEVISEFNVETYLEESSLAESLAAALERIAALETQLAISESRTIVPLLPVGVEATSEDQTLVKTLMAEAAIEEPAAGGPVEETEGGTGVEDDSTSAPQNSPRKRSR